MTAGGDADLASIGSVLADRSRCRILLALLDGRALPASVLASEAGVAASTASSHLGRLIDAGLVTVSARGRYRYYAIAGPEVAAMVEGVARVAPAEQVRSLRQGTKAHALRQGRTCYDHLAGRLGVAVTERLVALGAVAGSAADLGALPTRNDTAYRIDSPAVFSQIGVDADTGEPVPCCVDWTERRHHLAGRLGRDLASRFEALRWIQRVPAGRAVVVTEGGAKGFDDWIGLQTGASL